MRRWLVAALLTAVVASSAMAGGPRAVNGLGNPMKWSTATPVVYHPDQGTLGYLSNAEARALVAEAFAVWEAGPADITFAEGGVLSQDVSAAGAPLTSPSHFRNFYRNAGDGLSPVIFDTDGSILDAYFGEGARFEILGIAGIDTAVGGDTQITEASIIINGAFFDGIGLPSSPPDVTREGLKAAIVHEIGHFINLDHTVLNHELALDGNAGNDVYVPTMFPITVANEEALASTNPDDDLAAMNLYPSDAPANTFTGSVAHSGGGSFQGANVVFRKTDDPLMTAYSLISGMLYFPCNPPGTCLPQDPPIPGRFAADHFTPGQYRVCVEQIDTRYAISNGISVGPFATPAVLSGPEECFDGSEGGTQSDDPDDVTAVTAGSGSPVNIVLNALPASDPFEPNNTLGTGAALADLPTGSDTAPGVLAAADLDVFLVPVVAGQRVRIDIDAAELGSSLDAVVGFYNAGNALVARNDDGPDPDSSAFSFDPAIELIATFTGTAKVVVSSFPDLDQDGIGGGTTGPYWLRVEVTTDTDGDGAPDGEDVCPTTPRDDLDRDGVCFGADNCPTIANPTQDAAQQISESLIAAGDVTAFAIAPGGARVVYVADPQTDDVFQLYSVPIDGGTVVRLNTALVGLAKDVVSFKISPDGATVVYLADQNVDEVFEIFSVPIGGGTANQLNGALTTGGDVREYGISPDNARVVYRADQDVDGVDELFSVPIGGGTVTQLNDTLVAGGSIADPGFLWSFLISADSSTVVYKADQDIDDQIELYSVPITGGGTTKVNGFFDPLTDVSDFLLGTINARIFFTANTNIDHRPELYSAPLAGGSSIKLNGGWPEGAVGVMSFGIAEGGYTVIYRADQSTSGRIELYSVAAEFGSSVKINGPLVPGGNVTSFSLPVADGRLIYRADQATDEVFEVYSVPLGPGPVIKLNPTLVSGGDVIALGHRYEATALYAADQVTDGQVEVYSVLVSGGTVTKLSGTMVPGGNFVAMQDSATKVAIRMDKDTDDVFELYGNHLEGGQLIKLNGTLVAGGDVVDFAFTEDLERARVVYLADQDADEQFELYGRPFSVDRDADGVYDECDLCPVSADPGQQDADGNGVGDACQGCAVGSDPDADVVCGTSDNCPTVSNEDQTDFDADGPGDACDEDDDNDGLADVDETTAGTNPQDDDSDDDGVSDGDEVAAGTDPNDPGSLGTSAAFGPPSQIAFVSSPNSVFAADLDGDGDVDGLAASQSGDKVEWYENNGASQPSFTVRTITTAVDGAQSVIAADIDDDGDVDVLSASYLDDRIAWYENNGASPPAWTQRTITTSANGAWSVFAADVDGDGDVDALSASEIDNTIAWYENDGASPPGWTARSISTTVTQTSSIFAADVDGDGDIDALSTSVAEDQVAWFENDGASPPGWTERVVMANVDGAWSVFAADVDRDGDIDALSASVFDNRIIWHENNGASPPGWSTHILSTSAMVARSVYAADVDGDGDVDVLSASESDDTIAWYENDGAPQPAFKARTISTLANGARSVVAADLDHDGDLDALGAAQLGNSVVWYENETIHRNADFTTQRDLALNTEFAYDLATEDLDRDGDLDVLAALINGDRVVWFDNDGASPPGWTEREITSIADQAGSVAAADLDRDGDLDVLSASFADDTVAWYESDGNVPPAWTRRVISTTADGALDVAVADIDGDGDLDVLSTSQLDDDLVWYRSDGASPPTFTEFPIATSAPFKRGLATADMDGDGDLDVVSAELSPGLIKWYENDGGSPPSWTPASLIPTGIGTPIEVFPADVDGDGDIDVVTSTYADVYVAWFENNGAPNPAFTLHTIASSVVGWWPVQAADFDQDGDVDILSTSSYTDQIAWFVNDGAEPPNFSTVTISTTANQADTLAVGDLDGDGDLDVVSAWGVSSGGPIAYFENGGGQYALVTTSLAPATVRNGSTTAVLAVDLTSHGRAGDSDVELATLELIVTDGAGEVLSTAEANALIERLRVYLDDGSAAFQLGSETLVTTIDDLEPSPLVIPFAEGDPRVRVAPGQSKRLFVVVETTADAATRSPNTFRITHDAQAGSRARDAASGALLRVQIAADVTTPTITAIGDVTPPFVTSVFPPAGDVDVAPHTNVIVVVSEPIDPATAASGVTLSSGGVKVAGKLAVSEDGRTLSFDPVVRLASGADFELRVSGALRDRAGNACVAFTSTFAATSNPASGTLDPAELGEEGGGSVLEGANADDNSGFSAAAVGDVNGTVVSQGISDLVIGAPNADAGTVDGGEVRLAFGTPGLQSSSGTVVTLVYRTGTAQDHIGETVARAGDLNADGFQDFLIGAPRSQQAPAESGVVYVVFGNASLDELAPGPLDLDNLATCAVPTLCGLKFLGEVSGDHAGSSLSFAGDVDADGFDDVLIGAPDADPPGRAGAGKVYLIYGPLTPGTIALSSVGSTTRGLVFRGESAGDRVGASVSPWEDRNADGIDDLLLGAPGAEAISDLGVSIPDAGYVYAIQGGTQPGHLVDTATPGVIELSRVANGASDQVAGMVFIGSEPNAAIGRSVTGEVDIDGNGTADIIIAGNGVVFAIPGDGPKVVIGGTQTGGRGIVETGLARTLGALNAIDDFHAVRYLAADTDPLVVGPGGDLNHDGFDDFVIGAPLADGAAGSDCGKAYVVLGAPALEDGDRYLADVGDTIGGFVMEGAGEDDNLGASVGGGFDLNADGIDDGLIGAPFADTGAGTPSDAGETYVISPLRPGEVALLTVKKTGAAAFVEWSVTEQGASYNLYRGLLSTMRVTGGVRTSAMVQLACDHTGDTDADQLPDFSDNGVVPPSDAFVYLVTARNAHGEGSPGAGTPTRINDSQCP